MGGAETTFYRVFTTCRAPERGTSCVHLSVTASPWGGCYFPTSQRRRSRLPALCPVGHSGSESRSHDTLRGRPLVPSALALNTGSYKNTRSRGGKMTAAAKTVQRCLSRAHKGHGDADGPRRVCRRSHGGMDGRNSRQVGDPGPGQHPSAPPQGRGPRRGPGRHCKPASLSRPPESSRLSSWHCSEDARTALGFALVTKASLLVCARAQLPTWEAACHPDSSLFPIPHANGSSGPVDSLPPLTYISDLPTALCFEDNRLLVGATVPCSACSSGCSPPDGPGS